MSARMDTPLAELLLARGLVGRPLLGEALEHVRRNRGQDERVSLALFLLERRVLPAEVLEDALRHVARSVSPRDAVGEAAGQVATLGPYRLLRKIAEGGMGAVYEAEHAETGARYALKTIKADAGLLDEEALARLQREARLSAALDHPRVVRVHAAEFEGEVPYLVQDLLTGGTLSERVRQGGALAPQEAVELVAQLAEGLAAAHAAGILHRDLKPDNVLFSERGEPVLVDFGLSRRVSGNSIQLTQTGEILGTPAYMAPEQAMDVSTAREAADVYALGGILYFVLEGVPPFQGQTVLETLNLVLTEPAPEAANAPPALRALLARVLAKDPAERPSARELALLLRQSARSPERERALWPLVGSAALACAFLVGAALWVALAEAPLRASPGAPASAPPSAPPSATPSVAAGPVADLAEKVESGQRGVEVKLAALDLLRQAPRHPAAPRARALLRGLKREALARIPPAGKLRAGGFLPSGRSLYGVGPERFGRFDLEAPGLGWRLASGPARVHLSTARASSERLWVSITQRRGWVYSLPLPEVGRARLGPEPDLRGQKRWLKILRDEQAQGVEAVLAISPGETYLAQGQGNRIAIYSLEGRKALDLIQLPLGQQSKEKVVLTGIPYLKFVSENRLIAVMNKRVRLPLQVKKSLPTGGLVALLALEEGHLELLGAVSVRLAATSMDADSQQVYVGNEDGALFRYDLAGLPSDPSYLEDLSASELAGERPWAKGLEGTSRASGLVLCSDGALLTARRIGKRGKRAQLGRWTKAAGKWSYLVLGETPLVQDLILGPQGDLLLVRYHREVENRSHVGEVWFVGEVPPR